MSQPITPVNAIITIQALAPAVTNRDATGVDTLLTSLPDGTVVNGFVVTRDRNNNPVLRTPYGDVLVHSSIFLKTGSEVVFKVDPALASRARILTIDSLAPEEYAAIAATQGLTTDTIETPQRITAQALERQQLPVLNAIVLHALKPGATPRAGSFNSPQPPVPPALAQLSSGMSLTLTVTDVKLPPMPVAVNNLPQPAALAQLLAMPDTPSTSTTTKSAAPSAISMMPASENTPAQTSTSTALPYAQASSAYQHSSAPPLTHGTSTPLPNTPATIASDSLPAAAQRPVFTAMVIGHGEDGANILHTSFATLKLFTPQPLPTGTALEIQAEPAEATQHATPITTFSTLTPRTPVNTQDFAYLARALEQLTMADPTLTRELMNQLPVIGPKFTSGLVFFIAAAKHGNLREMLGLRTTSRLESLTPELVTRLGKDLAAFQQGLADSPLADWKPLPLPLIFGSAVEPAKLFIRKEADEEGTSAINKTGGGHRFLLNLHFSELGDMQFDGFIKNAAGSKSFDLVMRSELPLEGEINTAIRQIFEDAIGATGLRGQIIFQHGRERFVEPEAIHPQSSGGAPHTILA